MHFLLTCVKHGTCNVYVMHLLFACSPVTCAVHVTVIQHTLDPYSNIVLTYATHDYTHNIQCSPQEICLSW